MKDTQYMTDGCPDGKQYEVCRIYMYVLYSMMMSVNLDYYIGPNI
jgi:hypothetical protein